jgi:hypothetical protein
MPHSIAPSGTSVMARGIGTAILLPTDRQYTAIQIGSGPKPIAQFCGAVVMVFESAQ